ncbi:alpha/beta hydrolase [Salinibacillus xinjiangensis]|uniref:DUF3089 domain-containing protein n=1 Tax=Salinibacillus xinjiangensis TaxID=1229268 RepID=A0A6G1XBF3_9BACI|nr:DUF3089 domain-containing protein [Salinibacillus xinjiangensis]MRG88118.1 DUF3089 domain-containing protein [Salinibacillus xinjiangensis]
MSVKSFTKIQQEAISYVKNKEYAEALNLLEKAKSTFPEKLDRLGHWSANIYCLQGKQQEAIAELRGVLDGGMWWNPELLDSDPELSPLKDSEEFEQILEKCRGRYVEEKGAAAASLQVEGDPKSSTSIFAIHWKGSNAKEFAAQWSDPRLLKNYLLGFPQSSQLFSYNSYSWDDAAIAKADITDTFRQFMTTYNGRDKNNILAGASQGGRLAMELGIQGFRGFIALVPAIEHVNFADDFQPGPGVRGCVITGDQDPFYEATLDAIERLKARGVPCKLIVREGMGHTLPGDFAELVQDAVDFILGK